MRQLLLDTSAIIFYSQRAGELQRSTYALLESGVCDLYFSPVTAGELACLQERNRIDLGEYWKPWLRGLQRENHWTPIEVSYEIVEEAYSLPSDPPRSRGSDHHRDCAHS